MTQLDPNSPPARRRRASFGEDFRRFFMRGLAAIMPTLITLSLLIWVWHFLWDNIGQYVIGLIRVSWSKLYVWNPFHWFSPLDSPPPLTYQQMMYSWDPDQFSTRLIGVILAVVLIYFIGVFVGNLIGRTFWRMTERGFLALPLVRAIYPAVKQVTDFILAERSRHFPGSRVVAVQPHEQNIWSVGLVTNSSQWKLNQGMQEMVTVFIPSTPTSFSGYVLIVPRSKVVELPMTVEEAMRLLVSGGVIMPADGKTTGKPISGEIAALPSREIPVSMQPAESSLPHIQPAQIEPQTIGKIG